MRRQLPYVSEVLHGDGEDITLLLDVVEGGSHRVDLQGGLTAVHLLAPRQRLGAVEVAQAPQVEHASGKSMPQGVNVPCFGERKLEDTHGIREVRHSKASKSQVLIPYVATSSEDASYPSPATAPARVEAKAPGATGQRQRGNVATFGGKKKSSREPKQDCHPLPLHSGVAVLVVLVLSVVEAMSTLACLGRRPAKNEVPMK